MIRNLIVSFLFSCLYYASAQAQSLDSLLKLVAENNPELKALKLEFEAELLKVDQIKSIPGLQIGTGIPILKPETRLGPQLVMVSASQMFPWFGVRKSKGEVVLNMSKAKFERISAIRLELFNKVEVAYYELAHLENKEEVINNLIVQFNSLEQLALAKLESGQGRMTNVLRVQLKQDELRQNLKSIIALKQKYFAVINSLTLEPWSTSILVEQRGVQLFELNLEESKRKISENYPLILMLNQQIEASNNRQLVNKKMGAPMIGVGLDYSIVAERVDMNPNYNGRDIFVPKVMISVPLYRKKFRAKNEEEEVVQSSLELRKENLIQNTIEQLIRYNSEYESALIDLELNQDQIITMRKILELLRVEYSTSGGHFDEILQVQNQLFMFEIELSNSIKKANTAVSNIGRLINY